MGNAEVIHSDRRQGADLGEVSCVYDMSRPTEVTGPWPDEICIGNTGFDPPTGNDIFTPIYNDLRRDGALSWQDALAAVARPAWNSAAIGSATRPEGPQTSPIPIPIPTVFPERDIWPWEPASPLSEPRSQRPMSALARERAAVDAMLAALSLRPTPRPARALVAGSTAARPRTYQGTTPPPIMPSPRTQSPSFPGSGPLATRRAIPAW